MPDQSLCLCMIVKDEAPVIRRCLASVEPLIDSWLIVDTGSTDGTQDIVRDALAHLPGTLVERPWVDFATNRNEALELARDRAGYSLIIDADDELIIPQGFVMPKLDADAYILDFQDATVAYQRLQLFANNKAWRYVGVLHEFPSCSDAGPTGHLPLVIRRNHDGRRRRTANTYSNDATVLERALTTETDPFLVARYTFYLAQSYRDSHNQAAALEAYLRRADLGHWIEEVYVSLLNAGRLMEALERDDDDIIAVYRRATDTCPYRAEAAHGASRLCRLKARHELGYALGKPALDLAPPPGGLFVEPWFYDCGLRDEFAVNAYWAGRYDESLSAVMKALATGKVPSDEQARLIQNMQFSLDKLSAGGTAAVTPTPASKPLSDPDAGRASRAVSSGAPRDDIPSSGDDMVEAFTKVYGEDRWSHGSGPGSRPVNTIGYRAFLEQFIAANGIRTVIDLGCGDWQFSRLLDWSGATYTGFDVVDSIVEANRARYASDTISFERFRSIDELPGGDLLLAKEVLQHLPTQTVLEYIASIRRKYRFALLTNTVEPKALANGDIPSGEYRPLRLDEAPFNVQGAKVFSYVVDNGDYVFRNVVYLVLGYERPSFQRTASTYALTPPMPAPVEREEAPRVLLAILAKQKESVLAFYLACIEKLDYPKSSIVLYIRTNNNTDRTAEILRGWIDRVKPLYAHVEFDESNAADQVQAYGVHEWNATRFAVLANIRNESLRKTIEHSCEFYFVVDVDNFLLPWTLRDLVALRLPIVAPFIRHVDDTSLYSNYHADIDGNGYFRDTQLYTLVWSREVVGVLEMPVVHCTYLVRADVIPKLGYDDASGRHEYVVFSDRARASNVPQYIDNRCVYGLLTLEDDEPEIIAKQLAVAAKWFEPKP